jgi:hypothetical protein
MYSKQNKTKQNNVYHRKFPSFLLNQEEEITLQYPRWRLSCAKDLIRVTFEFLFSVSTQVDANLGAFRDKQITTNLALSPIWIALTILAVSKSTFYPFFIWMVTCAQ